MKIIDCFPFFNEFDLLEIRLKELWETVDYFVIVEAAHTQAGIAKPFYLLDNWNRFIPYAEKIIHVRVTDMPNNGDPYANDTHQRNAIMHGLNRIGIDSSDIIFVSDCDEIPRASALEFVKYDRLNSLRSYWSFRMPYFFYKFNYFQNDPVLYHQAGFAITPARLKLYSNDLTAIRREQGHIWTFFIPRVYNTRNEMSVQHAGWHFTYTGGNEKLSHKLANCADTHHWTNHKFDIDTLIQQNKSHFDNAKFTPVVLDNYFPKSITDDVLQYQEFIVPNATSSIRDILLADGIPTVHWI